jgi:hypothetical protein
MTYTPLMQNKMPLPVEPAVLSCHLVNSTAATDVPVYVPWKRCKLVYAYAVVTEAIDATGAMEIDLELNAADGTEFASISVSGSSSVGDIYEATIASYPHFDRDDASYDAVNVEIDGSAAAAGSVMLFMYFESDRG